ncbi:MAG: hypothetical protein GTO02_22350 [Candidatus Dadabacteria bacterium]|nr:hypothetical protein [Candidatus Dadabacteria bacterium]
MRAICSTFLEIGEKNIPIKVYSRVKSSSKTTGLSLACPECEGNINKVNVCKNANCSHSMDKVGELPLTELNRKYQVSKTEHVLFSKEQIETLKDAENLIEVSCRVGKSELDNAVRQDSYWILPDTKLEKYKIAYGQFTKALEELDDQLIMCNFALRGKQKQGVLTTVDGVMVLQGIAYDSDLNSVEEKPDFSKVSEEKITKAKEFIEKEISTEPKTEFQNPYTAKLEQMLEGGETSTGSERKELDDKDEGEFF